MWTSHAPIAPDLLKAYLETEYRVLGRGGFVLRCGEYSAALDAGHERLGVVSSAFITACNPYSQRRGRGINDFAQAALAYELELRRLRYVRGIGQHPHNGWRGEKSFLVFGIDRATACEIGLKYRQNGIVWCGLDAVPALVLLR